jgi:cell division septation protein DedD
VDSILPRNGRHDEFDDDDPRPEREFTLGTTMILGLFFSLAIVCAVFFAFGYQLGRRSVPSNALPAVTPATGTFSGFKPAPGSPLTTPDPQPAPPPAAVAVPYTPPPAPVKDDVSQAAPEPSPQPVPRPVPAVSTPSAGTAMVQIAAVSHQEDADLLVTSLKHRGYNVAIHPGPQDGLLHVQIGPFSSHKEADAMRQRLLNDGFNAIVKDTH